MNFRRGFFRLWLVFSILFVIGTAAVFFRDVKSEFENAAVEAYIKANGISIVPVACSDARGKAGIDYEVFDDPSTTIKCWYQVPKLRILFPEYKDLTDDQLSDRLYQKAGIQLTPTSPWSLVARAVSIAIGVPLIVLAVGSAFGWSLAGFSGERLKSPPSSASAMRGPLSLLVRLVKLMPSYYRAALYLCALIALTDAIWVLFVVPRLAAKDTRWVFELALAAAIITPLGLFIRSNFIRWLGGVFMVVWAAALLWPLISSGTAQFSRPHSLVFFSYYGFRGALSLLTAAILLWSKQFASEFSKLRENDSKYIVYLRRVLIWAIIAAALIATFNDIVKLASSP